MPVANAINHLEGYLLRGMVHHQAGVVNETAGRGQFYVYRHPNCDHLAGSFCIDAIAQASATVSVQAGSGTAATIYARATHLDSIQADCVAPFAASDTGYVVVTISATDCAVRWSMMGDLYRDAMSVATDNCVELYDATYPRNGLAEGEVISDSTRSGPAKFLTEPANCWNYARRQAVSWWTTTALSCASTSWTNPYGDDLSWTWRHKARRKTAATTQQNYRVYARTHCAAGVTYSWRCTTSLGTVTQTGLTQTSATWNSQTQLACDATATDAFTFQAQRTAGSGSIYITGISILEDD
jgi:hypothetical protein